MRLSPKDPNSYSRPDLHRVIDVFLKLDADFSNHILSGFVILTIQQLTTNRILILDSRNLSIKSVQCRSSGLKLDWSFGLSTLFGTQLNITLPETSQEILKIQIDYSTERDCSALQWLDPLQTAGKSQAFMFSQNQAIHCRSMIPIQDTPSLKAPYRAEITAPKDLTVLMSGVREGEPEQLSEDKRLHKFIQKIPIQSYLIAIAIGKLDSRKIGPRTEIWSEAQFIETAAFDFSETESMIKIAEDLCGPYVWGNFDILVLPPSFPYGGMENPCLTFVTPTLLTGDKSLNSVIAHELAHSWTGNLVTNQSFEHFWLNEGFTVFMERKILGRLYGEPARHFEAIRGRKSLVSAIALKGENHPLTSLIVNLNDIDPDDAFSVIPYEKGCCCLWVLEDRVGGPSKFEPFLKSYFEHFKFQSIESNQFKNYFLEYFKDINVDIDWESLFYKPGMPIYEPIYDDSLAAICVALKDKWILWDSNETPSPIITNIEYTNLSTTQKIEFVALLLLETTPLPIFKLEKMDALYELSTSQNPEIKYRWICVGLKAKWKKIVDVAVKMISEQGRMKYIRPIYRGLYDWTEERETALSTYFKNKSNMMTVACQVVETDLKIRK